MGNCLCASKTFRSVKLDQILLNARKHSAKQIRQIANSISVFDFTTPLLVSGNGRLIAGHGRYEAAKLLGLEKVPVIVVAGLSAARRRALGIADNQIAANATWDRKRLALEIPELTDELNVEGLDISILGFEKIEIDQIINIDCETKVADPPGEIDAKWFQPCTIWLFRERQLPLWQRPLDGRYPGHYPKLADVDPKNRSPCGERAKLQ